MGAARAHERLRWHVDRIVEAAVLRKPNLARVEATQINRRAHKQVGAQHQAKGVWLLAGCLVCRHQLRRASNGEGLRPRLLLVTIFNRLMPARPQVRRVRAIKQLAQEWVPAVRKYIHAAAAIGVVPSSIGSYDVFNV